MGSDRPLAILVAWILGLSLLGAWTAYRMPVSSDLTLFLPQAASTQEYVLLDQLHEGVGNRIHFAAVSGADAAARAKASRTLRSRLEASQHFLRVANGTEPFQGPERDFLLRHRYLLSPEVRPARFEPESLTASLRQRLDELRAPTSLVTKDLLARDPTGELLAILKRLENPSNPQRSRGVWVSRGGEQALLLLWTRAPGTALEAQQSAQEALQKAFQEVPGSDRLRLEVTGPGVFGVEARDRIRREASRLTLLGTLGVGVLLLFLFRSARILLLTALPLATGVLAGAWAVWLSFGAVHGITLAFGITLLGVALDYPLHLLTQVAGSTPARSALSRVWPTLRLGVLTTVAAYAILATTEFRGLVQLGIFAATGLATAAATTRWALPPVCPAEKRREWPRLALGRWLRPSWVLGTVLLAAAAASVPISIWSMPEALERDLRALSPVPEAQMERFQELREQLGMPDYRHFLIVTGESRQKALEKAEDLSGSLASLVEEGRIEAYRSPVAVLPSVATQRQRQRSLPSRQRLAANLEGATRDLPFREGLFQPFLEDVHRARDQAPVRLPDLEGTFLFYRAASLLTSLPRGHSALIPLKGTEGSDPLEAAAGVTGPEVLPLELGPATDRLVYRFMGAGMSRLGIGLLVLVLVLAVGLRSSRRLLGVVTPVVLALMTTLGLLLTFGEQLTLFHVLALLLVFGIGVDYTLFFERPGPDAAYRERTLHGLVACAGSTLLVFGLLATSDIPVLHQLGLTVFLGALASFLTALTFARRLSGSAAPQGEPLIPRARS